MDLTDARLEVFTPRVRTAQDMLSTLRRRSSNEDSPMSAKSADDERKSMRRRSAPSELTPRERTGFVSPRLTLPGAF